MGVNNKARRAARKRRRSAAQRAQPPQNPRPATYEHPMAFERPVIQEGPAAARPDEGPVAEVRVAEAVRLCYKDGRLLAPAMADRLLGDSLGCSADAIAAAMQRRMKRATHTVVRGGWGPLDLSQLIRRRLDPEHLPVLAAALRVEMQQNPAERVAAQWRDELAALGPTRHPALRSNRGLTLALGVAALLATMPRIPALMPPPGTADPLRDAAARADGPDAKMLARVRALLAKAQSSEFAEEAEALSAKAQELISGHSLTRLLEVGDEADRRTTTVVARRLWLDAPYASAKGVLVAVVAGANRCSAVSTDQLGFTTVVGTERDLDAVEVLATSLMVQADMAMLAAGRAAPSRGSSRTPSYRRSFLLAYARRIGERLTEADETVSAAVAGSSTGAALVPVLRDHAERVQATLTEMFPHTVTKSRTASNWSGWVAGRAAAELARLDGHRSIDSRNRGPDAC
jgi:hypothetical protein